MESPTTVSNTDVQSTADNKILADLNVLKEKMELCENMLNPGEGSPAPSLKNNETLLAVIGFLEACAPRMVELVETAAQGALSENVLMDALQVNDSLQKLLGDIDTFAFTETPAATTAASAPASSIEDDLDNLLLDDSATGVSTHEDPFATLQSTAPSGKTTGEETDEDPFASLQPSSAAAKTTGQEDPFASLQPASAGEEERMGAHAPTPAGPKTTGDEDPFAALQPTPAGPKTTGEDDPFEEETLFPAPPETPAAARQL